MNLNAQRFHIVRSVGASREVGQIELDLIPALVQAHRHRADERLDARRRLVVAGAEAPSHVLVVEHLRRKSVVIETTYPILHNNNPYLHLEREVFLQVLDDHHQKGQLDAQRLLRVGRARDERRADVRADDLEHQTLDVVVRDPFDVAIAHFFVPDLQRFAADAVQNGQEARLKRIFEHFYENFFLLLFLVCCAWC